MVGVLFLAACGNTDEDISTTGNMNKDEMSDDMETEEGMNEESDMENEEMMEDGMKSEETKDGM